MTQDLNTTNTKYGFIVPTEKKYTPRVDRNARSTIQGKHPIRGTPWRQTLKISEIKTDEGIVFSSEFQVIDKFLRKLMKGSGYISTVHNMMYKIQLFMLHHKITNPDELLAHTDESRLKQLIQEWGDSCKQRGLFKRTVNDYMKGIVWWCKANGLFPMMKIEDVVDYYRMHARERKTFVYLPTNAEVHAIANAVGTSEIYKYKYKAGILMTHSCGFRISTLCALRWRDVLGNPQTSTFPIRFRNELDNEHVKNIIVPCYPEMKKVIPEACKNSIPYISFISSFATDALRRYRAFHESYFGEPVDPDEAILCSDIKQGNRIIHTGVPIATGSFGTQLKKGARRAMLDEWKRIKPHESLRDAFQAIIRSRRMDGTLMDQGDQEYLMGHLLGGSRENYYSIQWLERLRNEYSKLDFSPSSMVGTPVEKVIAKYGEYIENLENRLAKVEGKPKEPEPYEDELTKRVKKILSRL